MTDRVAGAWACATCIGAPAQTGGGPPVDGFRSLTLHKDKHLFHANDLKR